MSSIQFIGLAGYRQRPDVIGGMRNYDLWSWKWVGQ